MKKFIRPIVAGFLAAATFFGVGGAMEITKRNLLGSTSESSIFQAVNAQTASGVPNPVCFDNYQSWNSSGTYKTDADWSTWFVAPYMAVGSASSSFYKVYNNFERDINGDGLPDYMYIDHLYITTGAYNKMNDCVYLSNGHGWELAYRCVATKPAGSVIYYGDCAA